MGVYKFKSRFDDGEKVDVRVEKRDVTAVAAMEGEVFAIAAHCFEETRSGNLRVQSWWARWPAGMPPPNILLLTTDQQRADTVAAWQRATGGAGTAHSPNADRLAREGVVFTDAYTASPVCAPARASLLLGVHVPVHGVFDNSITRYVVNSSTPYPSLLKKAGYVTALIGKARFRPA